MQTVETSAIRLHYKTFRFLFQLLNFFVCVFFCVFVFVFWGWRGGAKILNLKDPRLRTIMWCSTHDSETQRLKVSRKCHVLNPDWSELAVSTLTSQAVMH